MEPNLKLKDLKINSFVIVSDSETRTVKGGSGMWYCEVHSNRGCGSGGGTIYFEP